MSADNMICVQKRLGRWWVWMGFASDDVNGPNEAKDQNFDTREKAMLYASGWVRGEMWLKYGLQELEPQTTLISIAGDSETAGRVIAECPSCHATGKPEVFLRCA